MFLEHEGHKNDKKRYNNIGIGVSMGYSFDIQRETNKHASPQQIMAIQTSKWADQNQESCIFLP